MFAVFACGFKPRCALELDDSGQTRIDKLYGIIGDCRYGIHDLSRTELDAVNDLPRFNMPLELGIFLGARRYGDDEQRSKRCLVLDVEQYRYQKFISDLAGMDIHAHGGDPRRAVRATRDWLTSMSRRRIPGGQAILGLWDSFSAELPTLCQGADLRIGELTYADYEALIFGWLTR